MIIERTPRLEVRADDAGKGGRGRGGYQQAWHRSRGRHGTHTGADSDPQKDPGLGTGLSCPWPASGDVERYMQLLALVQLTRNAPRFFFLNCPEANVSTSQGPLVYSRAHPGSLDHGASSLFKELPVFRDLRPLGTFCTS